MMHNVTQNGIFLNIIHNEFYNKNVKK